MIKDQYQATYDTHTNKVVGRSHIYRRDSKDETPTIDLVWNRSKDLELPKH